MEGILFDSSVLDSRKFDIAALCDLDFLAVSLDGTEFNVRMLNIVNISRWSLAISALAQQSLPSERIGCFCLISLK